MIQEAADAGEETFEVSVPDHVPRLLITHGPHELEEPDGGVNSCGWESGSDQIVHGEIRGHRDSHLASCGPWIQC